jgi:hypothetical protein
LLIQQRDVFDDPTIERGMVDLDAALFHHFLELPIADRIGHIPADAPQDYLTLKMAAFELNHRAVPLDPFPAIIPQASAMQSLRQNPPIKGAPKVVTTIESATPRMVLESPNNGCPSARFMPPSAQEHQKLCDDEGLDVRHISLFPPNRQWAVSPKWQTASRSAKSQDRQELSHAIMPIAANKRSI